MGDLSGLPIPAERLPGAAVRAVVLHLLGDAVSAGCRFRDLCRDGGLSRKQVENALLYLLAAGLVIQDGYRGRFRLPLGLAIKGAVPPLQGS